MMDNIKKNKELENLTDKMSGGKVICLASRPGIGKTSLIYGIMGDMILNDKNILLFSLETTKNYVSKRFEELLSDVEINMLNPRMMPCLYVDDTTCIDVEHIYDKSKEINEEMPLDLIVLDYMQLMRTENIGPNKDSVKRIVSRLKELAEEINVPVIYLTQLSRAVDHNPEPNRHRPTWENIISSGNSDADVVIMLYCKGLYYEECDGSRDYRTEVIIADRNGKPVREKSIFIDLAYIQDILFKDNK